MSSYEKEIEAIAQEIRRRAEEEEKRILKEAEEEARRIIEEAKERAEKMFQHEAQSRVMILRRRIIGSAEQDARIKLIEEKNKVMNRVLESALSRLEKIVRGEDPNHNYEDILISLMREAVEKIAEPKIIVRLNNRDKKFVVEKLNEIKERIRQETGLNVDIEVAEDNIDAIGGLIASNSDGTKVFYNTLEGRLYAIFEKTKPKIAKILFG